MTLQQYTWEGASVDVKDVDVISQCSSPQLTKSSLYGVPSVHIPQLCVLMSS